MQTNLSITSIHFPPSFIKVESPCFSLSKSKTLAITWSDHKRTLHSSELRQYLPSPFSCENRIYLTAKRLFNLMPDQIAETVLQLPKDIFVHHIIPYLPIAFILSSVIPLCKAYLRLLLIDSLDQFSVVNRLLRHPHCPFSYKVELIAKAGSHLQQLNLAETRLTEPQISQLIHLSPKLIQLNLKQATRLTLPGFQALIPFLKHLKVVNLSQCSQIQIAALEILGKNCPNLEAVNLAKWDRLTDQALINLIQNCPKIRSLNLALCYQITDLSLKKMTSLQLQELCIAACAQVHDAGVSDLMTHSFHLKSLDFSCCYNITHIGLKALADYGSSLQILSLVNHSHLKDSLLVAIMQTCKNLRKINLMDCSNLSYEGFKSLALYGKYLQKINLNECKRLDDNSLLEILQACRCLQKIELRHCVKITDVSLKAFAFHSVYLRKINLSGCHQITDNGFNLFLEKCTFLQTLIFADSPLQQKGLNGIVLYGKKLEEINLSKSSHLTNESVLNIIKDCLKLKTLNISHCQQITHTFLNAFQNQSSKRPLEWVFKYIKEINLVF